MTATRQVATKDQGSNVALANRSLESLTFKDVKEFICPKATNQEAEFFVRYAMALRLDPFLGQIHLVKYANQPAYIVIDVYEYIKPATLQKNYDGFKAGLILKVDGKIEEREGEFYITKSETLLGAWCQCFRKDVSNIPIVKLALELWDKKQATWRTNPAHMIYKTAVKHSFKQSFPGIYSNFPEDDFPINEDEEITVVDTITTHDAVTGEVPDTSEITKEQIDQRRMQFFKYMWKKHKLSSTQDIRDRVSEVLKKPVESLSDFFQNDQDFMAWAEGDQFTMDFDKVVGELFGKE